MTDNEHSQGRNEDKSRAPVGLIIAGVILVAVTIFIAQNTEDIEIQYLTLTGSLPLWILLVIFMILGFLLGQSILWLRRRRKRRRDEEAHRLD